MIDRQTDRQTEREKSKRESGRVIEERGRVREKIWLPYIAPRTYRCSP